MDLKILSTKAIALNSSDVEIDITNPNTNLGYDDKVGIEIEFNQDVIVYWSDDTKSNKVYPYIQVTIGLIAVNLSLTTYYNTTTDTWDSIIESVGSNSNTASNIGSKVRFLFTINDYSLIDSDGLELSNTNGNFIVLTVDDVNTSTGTELRSFVGTSYLNWNNNDIDTFAPITNLDIINVSHSIVISTAEIGEFSRKWMSFSDNNIEL